MILWCGRYAIQGRGISSAFFFDRGSKGITGREQKMSTETGKPRSCGDSNQGNENDSTIILSRPDLGVKRRRTDEELERLTRYVYIEPDWVIALRVWRRYRN